MDEVQTVGLRPLHGPGRPGMTDMRRLRSVLLFGVAGAALMAILSPVLALVRDTTGHDWYAAGKLIVTEAMIAVGFDPQATTEYTAADGSVRRITRLRVTFTVEAWQARSHILSTITDNALLGAGAGFAGAVLLAFLPNVANGGRSERLSRAVVEPMHRSRRLAAHDESNLAEVLSRTEGCARIALMVTPAEIDRLAGTLKQAGQAALLPAVEPGEGLTQETSMDRLREPESASQDTEAEWPRPDDAAIADSSGGSQPPEESTGSSRKRTSGGDGSSVARKRPKRPRPGEDVDWF